MARRRRGTDAVMKRRHPGDGRGSLLARLQLALALSCERAYQQRDTLSQIHRPEPENKSWATRCIPLAQPLHFLPFFFFPPAPPALPCACTCCP